MSSSKTLLHWQKQSANELDEIEAAHAGVSGTGPGRRFATLRINHAYVVLLSSAFQRFCRDLHSEGSDFLASQVVPSVRFLFQRQLTQGRELDRGNPGPGNLGKDFGRFFATPSDFWKSVTAAPGFASRRNKLEELMQWRNAIAHQDWTKLGPRVHLKTIRGWRSACNLLAVRFDRVVGAQLQSLTGKAPW